MEKPTLYCIRVDADAKKGFEAVCAEIGLTHTEALNMYMRVVVREGCLPFEIAIDRKHGYRKIKNLESAPLPSIPNVPSASRGAFDMETLVSLMRAKRLKRSSGGRPGSAVVPSREAKAEMFQR